jgi:hypothetical protein
MPASIQHRITTSLLWRTPNHVSPPINLKVHPEHHAEGLAISVPATTKGTFTLSLGQVWKLLYDRIDPVVAYTFVVEAVNPFETVARVCSHMVASGKS